MAAIVASIHQYFDNYGWQYEFEENSNTWHTGFRGNANNFSVFVHLTENWLYFTISPFVNAPIDPVRKKKLHYLLLRLNHTINMAKFGLDSDSDVVLTVDLPIESLNFSEFADGLNALSFYADAHYLKILNAAQDPDYSPTFGDEPEIDGGSSTEEGGVGWESN